MREDDLTTLFSSLSWVKAVFADGRLEDVPQKGNRNLMNMPYIEFVVDHDYREHDTTSRMRRCVLNGRVVFKKYISSAWKIKNSLELLLKGRSSDQFHWSFDEPDELGPRTEYLPFSIEYFESVEKTA